MKIRPLRSIVSDIESSTLSWGWWVLTFIVLVVTRNLLEGVLGPERILGFVYFASPSSLMVLDHFLFFYVSLFLSFSILLSILAREEISRVMRIMVSAWGLVLLPPVVDFLMTSGQGIRISYVLRLSSVLFRFFDPRAVLESVSAGQRIEIIAACLLGAFYVRLKTGRWWRSVLAFVGLYLLVGAHGVLPSAFARAWWAVARATPATAAVAYEAAFKGGGLVQEESRKLALLFQLSSGLLAWLALRLHAPAKERMLRLNWRPLRTLHYVAMAALGIAIGNRLMGGTAIGVAASGGDLLGIVGVFIATVLAVQASVWLNDLHDIETDRIAAAERPLASGALACGDALPVILVLAAGALIFALNVKYSTFLLMVVCLSMSFLYSAPPARLKRVPLVATLLLGFTSFAVALVGFSIFAEERSFQLFPARLGWLLVLSFGLAFTAKDLKDMEGDRAAGVLTLPVIFGRRLGRAMIAALVMVGYLLVPILLPFRVLLVPAIVVGGVSAAAVLLIKRPGLDRILLAIYLAFAIVVGVVAVRNVDALHAESTLELADAKAAQLAGRSDEGLKRWEDASALYRAALERPSDDPAFIERAGVVDFLAGRYERSVTLLGRAVELAPHSPVAWEYLATSLARVGRTGEAAATLNLAIGRRLRPGLFHGHLGELLLELGRHDDAILELRTALRMGQPTLPTRLRVAEALAVSGDARSALSEFQETVRREPDSGEAHEALGLFYHSTGDVDRALAELVRATELAPAQGVYWNNLGVLHLDMAQHDMAMAALNQAVAVSPSLVEPYYNRGRVLDAVGRQSEARRQYLLALELDPGFGPARSALSRPEIPQLGTH